MVMAKLPLKIIKDLLLVVLKNVESKFTKENDQ